MRRFLNDGALPPAGAVRIEELINYFRFDYPQPAAHEPFSITTELTACPWNPRHRLALIGLQGESPEERDPAPRNLVFLIDVSGSMKPHDKLPLVRTAMHMLTDILTRRDRVAIVVYAGSNGLVLPSTSGDRKEQIGAGHSVTALYEIVPVGVKVDAADVDPLKYQRETRETWAARTGELLTVKVRYKAPDGETSRLLSRVLMNRPSAMTANVGFASAVAEFGMLLRGSPSRGRASFESASARAKRFQGEDEDSYRAEFIELVDRAATLRQREPSQSRWW